MKHLRQAFHQAPITHCALSWRGWIWRALDIVLDFLLLAAAGTMIGYALGNFLY